MTPRGYIRLGLGIAFALLVAWGLRVDHLRAGYKQQLATIKIAFEDIGEKVGGYDKLPVAVYAVDIDRKNLRAERDDARGRVATQTNSIRALEAESKQAIRLAETQRMQIEELTRQRDTWIRVARNASTRTERLSAEEEAKQCEDAMDRLYQQGF